MDNQSDQHGIALVAGDKFAGVSFLAEVEVRGDGMFEEVDDEIAEQDQKSGIFSGTAQNSPGPPRWWR